MRRKCRLGLEESLMCYMSLPVRRGTALCVQVWLLVKQDCPPKEHRSRRVPVPSGQEHLLDQIQKQLRLAGEIKVPRTVRSMRGRIG